MFSLIVWSIRICYKLKVWISSHHFNSPTAHWFVMFPPISRMHRRQSLHWLLLAKHSVYMLTPPHKAQNKLINSVSATVRFTSSIAHIVWNKLETILISATKIFSTSLFCTLISCHFLNAHSFYWNLVGGCDSGSGPIVLSNGWPQKLWHLL